MPDASAGGPLTLGELADIDVGRLRGVGTRKRSAASALGIETVLDLLTHYPFRWIDRTRMVRIADLHAGDDAVVLLTVKSSSGRRVRGRSMVEVLGSDGSGTIKLTFFNQPWRERQLTPGLEVAASGKADEFRGRVQLTNPLIDMIGNRTGRIVPVYPQSEKAGVSTRDLADWVEEALAKARPRGLADPVPRQLLARHDLVERAQAIQQIHFPDSMAEQQQARRRLVFDELLRIQLALVLRKRALEAESRGVAHDVGGELVARFHGRLPFPLTGAQRRVIAEIDDDLARAAPMHRLLQGDVGSGKTVVAVTALLRAVQGGHQGALMAPTEVLAEQHAAGVRVLLSDLTVPDQGLTLLGDRPLSVELLTSRTTAAERRRLLAGLEQGTVDLVIGTHALLEEGVRFRSLGVVVIDEQHRFGVEQRAALRAKGRHGAVPDLLVMTATPIPRTAAMTVYGDLDVSVLDELPPGRTPIRTEWPVGEGAQDEAWTRVRDEVAAGHQAYVVCPLVEGSEKVEVASAEETFVRLSEEDLSGLRLALLHGRMSAADKQVVMDRFRSGEVDVLVATTVVEVGVDVPNATVIVILDADRFGIAQLHQLRGRVGRGTAASWCYLVAGPEVLESARLEALVASDDGFALAEVDLDLRGEGTVFGAQQKGRNDLKLASLRRDREWVGWAREAAFAVVDADPGLSRHPQLADELRVVLSEDDAAYLLKG